MMKPSDLLNIPDEHGYRLIDVKRIFRYRDGYYDLSLYFQRIENADELIYNYKNEVPDKQSIKSFSKRISLELTANVEFTRCFVIGSIWWKDRFPLLPSYFGEFDISTNFLGFSQLPKHFQAHNYIDLPFLPKHDKNSKIYLQRPDISVYELNTPLKLYSVEGNSQQFTTKPNKSIPKDANFISFHNYEIYRYFLTAKGEGNLNQRFLTSEILSNQKSKNHIFDPISSRTELLDGKEHNLVYLNHYIDKRNTELIGNVIFNQNFKFQINHIRRKVQIKAGRTFGEGISLPIAQFDKMKLNAKWVKNKSNEWGLLVFQIKECNGYNDLSFTPVIRETEVNPGGKDVVKVKVKKKRKNDSNSGNESFDHHLGGGSLADTIKVESDELLGLLNPPNETIIKKAKVELNDAEGKLKLITEKELKDKQRIAGPSVFQGDDDQLSVEIKKEINPIDYFVFFNIILRKLKVALQVNGFIPKIDCLNSDFQLTDDYLPIQYSKIKTKLGTADDVDIWLFFSQICISGHYFYLLEKEIDITSGIDRTWLFALPKFRVITPDEIPDVIKGYVFISQKHKRTVVTFPNKNLELDLGLNHKHVHSDQELERLREKNPDREIHEKLTKEEAIDKHVNRILKKIKSALNNSN